MQVIYQSRGNALGFYGLGKGFSRFLCALIESVLVAGNAYHSEMQIFAEQMLFDLIKLVKSVVDRGFFRAFSYIALSAFLIGHKYTLFRYYGIDHRYRVVWEQTDKLFAEILKRCGLYLADAVLADRVADVSVHLDLVKLLVGLDVIFQRIVQTVFRQCAYTAFWRYAQSRLAGKLEKLGIRFLLRPFLLKISTFILYRDKHCAFIIPHRFKKEKGVNRFLGIKISLSEKITTQNRAKECEREGITK